MFVKIVRTKVESKSQPRFVLIDLRQNYKILRYWKFVDGFPMTVTGKIRKVEMREMAIENWACRRWRKSGHHKTLNCLTDNKESVNGC